MPLMLVEEAPISSLEVDSLSLCKVLALESIKLCWMITFSFAFIKLSDSSGSELSDDMVVLTILDSLHAAMVTE